MTQHLIYKEVPPAKALSEYVINYWLFENKAKKGSEIIQHRALADGCTSLCFYRNEEEQVKYPFLYGPDTKNFEGEITPGSIYLGIRFRPGVTKSLLGVDGIALRGQTIWDPEILPKLNYLPILDILQAGFTQFNLLDDWLTKEINLDTVQLDFMVQEAVNLILKHDGDLKIKALAKTINLSDRQLQRRFKKTVGLTPKEFSKIRKVRTAVIQLLHHKEDYQDVIYNAGYFDQAHFIHDFSAIVGTNPTLFEKYISQIEHIGITNL